MATRDLTRVTSSLDQPIGDDGDTTLGELRAEVTADLEDEVLEREQSAVEDALRKLPELEAECNPRPVRHGQAPREVDPRRRARPGRDPEERGEARGQRPAAPRQRRLAGRLPQRYG